MKLAIFGILLLFTASAKAQDMFLQTRLEQGTLSSLIDKTRILLNNTDIGDHMSGEVNLTDDVNFSLSEVANDPNYNKFRDIFSSVFNLDLTNAVIRIRIPKIAYNIEELHAKPLSMSVQDPTLTLNITTYIRGLTTKLSEGLDLDLMIKNPKSDKMESYLTAHLVPTTINVPNTVEPISFDVKFETIRDQEFSFNVKNYDFSAVPDYVNRHLNDLSIVDNDNKPISADSITVNPVTIKLGSMARTVEFDSFKPILQRKLDQIITSIISNLGKSLKDTIGPQIIQSVFSSKTNSDLIVTNDSLYTRFLTTSFSQPSSNQLYLGVTGELCTAELYQQYHEQCSKQEKLPDPVRSISEEDRQKSNSEITENLARGDSDLILSMSEEYINRLLHTTIKAKLWNEFLEKQHLALGPKGAFMVFDTRTKTPELFLDILYMGEDKGVQKVLINKHRPIRFPLRISTSLDFVNVDGIPHMVIKTEKVLSTMNEIIKGIPEYDLHSHLIFGLKKVIAKMILKMSLDIEGKTAVDLDLPIFKNIDLEKTWHEASPFGRLNLFFKL